MGGGSWTTSSFASYTTTTRGMSVDAMGIVDSASTNAQDFFKARGLRDRLNPKNVVRQCLDTEEHPNTIPVILALDVTGSMGTAATEIAKKLNVIMTNLYEKIQDVEFLVMGIGDLACDDAPIQASQFESDIRIAEQLDDVYFEFGGGGNSYESYTAAWYFGSRHTQLDCWKRGKKGIIITMGDEQINPYLPARILSSVTGDGLQGDVETKDLYEEASAKFDIYHLDVNHRYRHDDMIKPSFMKYLDEKHFREVSLDSIVDEIVEIIVSSVDGSDSAKVVSNNSFATVNENGEISW
jgi:hypothetical protein